jgi:hypothetical protein
VKTDSPSACATLNWKVCKSAIALYLSVLREFVTKVLINSIFELEPVNFVTRTTLQVTICSTLISIMVQNLVISYEF